MEGFFKMIIDASQLRKGTIFKYNNDLYVVVAFQHLTPGNWRAYMQTKNKNLRTGSISEVRFRAHDKIETVDLEHKTMEYLYHSDGEYHFMDTSTYDQVVLTDKDLGDAMLYMISNSQCQIQYYENNPVGVILPITVDLKVEYTEPGMKGNTVSGATKSAKMETGLEIQVPLFINIGECLRVDTRTGEYIERVN